MSQAYRSFVLALGFAIAVSVSGCDALFGIRERPVWTETGGNAGLPGAFDRGPTSGGAGAGGNVGARASAGADADVAAGAAPFGDAGAGSRVLDGAGAQENAGAGGLATMPSGQAGGGGSACTGACPELGALRCSAAGAEVCVERQGCRLWANAGSCMERALVHVGTCTGTIVDPLWILTARRCVSDASGKSLDPISISARPGLDKIHLPASAIVLHPDPAIDVALIRLETPLSLGQPEIQWFDGPARSLSGREVVSYGYGLLGQHSNVACDASFSAVCADDETCDADAGRCRATSALARAVIARVAGLSDNAEYVSVACNGKYLRVQSAGEPLQGAVGGPTFAAGQLIAINSGPEYSSYVPRFRNWLRGWLRPRPLAFSKPELAFDSSSKSLGQPLMGDFNADGFADIAWIADTSGAQRGQVMVALNLGNGSFEEPKLWHPTFVLADERPDVGDFDGDGRDDLITFNENASASVTTSDGARFGVVAVWNNLVSYPLEWPGIGDFNGDGRADTVNFVTYQGWGDVYVNLSCASHVPPTKCSSTRSLSPRYNWETSFNGQFDLPRVGDVDGDNLADLVTLTPQGKLSVSITARQHCDWSHACDHGTCWSALGICPNSPGLAVMSGDWAVGHDGQWLAQFPPQPQLFQLADMNSDGLADAVAFTSSGEGLSGPLISLSTGAYFEPPSSAVATSVEKGTLPRLADVDGDGRTDIVTITSDESGTRVFVRYAR